MKRQAKTINLIQTVINILNELQGYWPLTLRQIYYQLVSRQVIENHKREYQRLSGILARAREDGLILWSVMEDRTRILHDLSGWSDNQRFIKSETKYFLDGYRRDLLQSQKHYIEIWVEKDALSRIFTQTAGPFTIPVVVSRGFSSVSFLNEYKRRALNHEYQTPLILYFSDLDPSGLAIPESVKDGLFSIGIDVQVKRYALLPEDITRYNLPHDPEALKPKDTRSKKYISIYGNYAVELDALHPSDLIDRITESIIENIDIQLFDMEAAQEKNDLSQINTIRERVLTILGAA